MINVLIIDDEPEACANLQNILSEYIEGDICVKGCFHSTREAEAQITLLAPDAVFLDIEMPHENAFQFLERLEHIRFEIIFVTAYDEYAIRAFKLNAVDYILKPINISDLQLAVGRMADRLHYKRITSGAQGDYRELSEQIRRKKEQHHIIIRENHHMETVALQDIIYVKAMGSYSRLYYRKGAEDKNVLMSRPIAEYETLFPAEMFFRSHRSYLVNGRFLHKISREEMQVRMTNGEVLPIGRRRFSDLLTFLKSNRYGPA